MEMNQESNEQQPNEEQSQSQMKVWLQENMRIIISVLIVVLIAGGIYSYSKRTEAPEQTPVAMEDEQGSIDATEGESMEGAQTVGEQTQETAMEEQKQPQAAAEKAPEKQNVSSVASSQETESSFVETAVKGDSKTTLARRALADYLEKNPDSALSAEHKIYIEDYLRKTISPQTRVGIGTSVEFSKDLIKNAIEKSKTLNERQIQNLHKYVVRVPSLS